MPITALNSIFLPYLIPDPLLGFFPNKLFFVFFFQVLVLGTLNSGTYYHYSLINCHEIGRHSSLSLIFNRLSRDKIITSTGCVALYVAPWLLTIGTFQSTNCCKFVKILYSWEPVKTNTEEI